MLEYEERCDVNATRGGSKYICTRNEVGLCQNVWSQWKPMSLAADSGDPVSIY